MTKTKHHKLILWLPLLFMAFYTSVQISKIHTTAQTNYNSMSVGEKTQTANSINIETKQGSGVEYPPLIFTSIKSSSTKHLKAPTR